MSDDEVITRRADLAFGILKFIGVLGFGVILWGVLDVFVVADLFGSVGLAADGAELSQTQQWMSLAWTAVPFILLVGLALRLISRAAFESRGGV